MANKGKGNGKANGNAPKSVLCINVDEAAKTAEVSVVELGKKDENGNIYVLVRDHAVDALARVAYTGKSKRFLKLTAQDIRKQIKKAGSGTFTVNIDTDKMDDEAEVEVDEVEVVEAAPVSTSGEDDTESYTPTTQHSY